MAPAGQTERVAATKGGRGATRVVAACANLLLAVISLLPFWGWLPANLVPAGIFITGLFALSVWRPVEALVALAGLLVLGVPLGVLLHAQTALQEPMILAFLGGWFLHAALAREAGCGVARRAVVLPACLFAATIAASAAAQSLAMQPVVAPLGLYVRLVGTDLARDYLNNPTAVAPLRAAAPMLEGIGLLAAAVALCRERRDVERLLRMAVAGASALAALNVVRFVSIPLRAGVPLFEGLRGAHGVRISVLGDFNAVGSYLAMMLFVAIGMAIARRRLLNAWWPIAGLVLVALWLTGSRTALLAVPFGMIALPILFVGRHGGRGFWLRLAGFTAALIVVVLAIARLAPPDAGLRPVRNMVGGRLEMARVSLEIFREEPIFGIGLDRFLSRSARYVRFENAGVVRENAHNNFLQVLAELGLVGFLTFAWTLVGAGVLLGKALGCRDAIGAGVAAALLTFLFTCLAGHPLLTRTVSFEFWLVLGAAAAWGPNAEAGGAAASWRRTGVGWLATALVALIVLSLPVRAEQVMRKEANLERLSSGFSGWAIDGEGTKYRTATQTADFYVRQDVCRIVVPMRSDGAREAMVELRLDGRLVTRVRAPVGSWIPVAMIVPSSDDRFREVEIRPTGAAVRVGEIAKSTCGRR